MKTLLDDVALRTLPIELDRELICPLPRIRRRGIRWSGGAGSPLILALEFENPDALPSAPSTVRVDVAPFGVFLPWNPLARVEVPPIAPGGRRVVTETLDGDEPLPPPPASMFSGLLAAIQGLPLPSGSAHSAAHFVGNLNVFVSRGQPVERHLQQAVGLRRGVPNFALFCVGDDRDDRYTFSPQADPGWELKIAGVEWGRPRKIRSEILPLSITPPPAAESGKVSVLVTRGSTLETVPVEFELEAGSGGSKCYFF
jgi:hypothetical protein